MSDDGTLLPIGARAPAIRAEGSDGEIHELGALLARGDVALFFYPGNNTPG